MNSVPLIRVESISKKFCKSLKHVMAYGAIDITRDFFGIPSKTHELRSGEFWAVNDISFTINRGEMIGLIGPNGSGKSTILKMLNGIYMPDSGRIEVNGRIGALIEIGAGFHPQLTGRENVYVNGAILGMTKRELDRKFDEIVRFSEIGDFIDAPVKNYSSGMYVRLGFSIAVHCEPEILLVDEVLAVGDSRFHNKCTNKIKELVHKGTAIVLVTHGGWYLQSLCQKAILINQGHLVLAGSPLECYNIYTQLGSTWKPKHAGILPSDDAPVVIKNSTLRTIEGTPIETIYPDTPLALTVRYACRAAAARGYFFLRVTTIETFPLYTSYSDWCDFAEGEGTITARMPSLSLLEGEYCVWIGIFGEKDEVNLYNETMMHLYVKGGQGFPDPRYGVLYNKVIWQQQEVISE